MALARVLALLILSTPLLRGIHQQEDRLKKAAGLREASVVHFKAKRYGKAAELLALADAIYVKQRGDFAVDRSVVLRDLVNNQNLAGLQQQAMASFRKLSLLAATHSNHLVELREAYVSMSRLAEKATTLERREAKFTVLRRLLRKHGHKVLAAQVLHDHASVIGDSADLPRMAAMFTKCVNERLRLKDFEGAAWSYNNRGYNYMHHGQLSKGLKSLAEGMKLVLRGDAIQAQGHITTNFHNLIKRLAESKNKSHDLPYIRKLVRLIIATKIPHIISPGQFFRSALAMEISSKSANEAFAVARRWKALNTDKLLPEVRFDLTLRSAAAALQSKGKQREVLKWLQNLDPGKGPCAPHLQARREVWLAVAYAKADDAKAFDRHARIASEAFLELGDLAGHAQALARLVEGSKSLRESQERASIKEKLSKLPDLSRLGGVGGIASRNNPGELSKDRGIHEPLFSISNSKKGLVLKDLIGGETLHIPVKWAPRHYNFNGIGLECFGGYVVLRFLDYGNVRASGSAATTTLEELESYMPIPERGKLLVTAHWALSYER